MKIINNIKWLILVAMAPLFAACSWEELPTYEDANIEGVAFYYRYHSPNSKDPITGEPMTRNVALTAQNVSIDTEAGTVTLNLTVVKNQFPSEDRDLSSTVTLNNVVGTVTLSTAARLEVADGHKALGLPDDWTSPHKFTVMAANGTKKSWTITVNELKN